MLRSVWSIFRLRKQCQSLSLPSPNGICGTVTHRKKRALSIALWCSQIRIIRRRAEIFIIGKVRRLSPARKENLGKVHKSDGEKGRMSERRFSYLPLEIILFAHIERPNEAESFFARQHTGEWKKQCTWRTDTWAIRFTFPSAQSLWFDPACGVDRHSELFPFGRCCCLPLEITDGIVETKTELDALIWLKPYLLTKIS